jgi:hypothetical protein
LHALQHTRQGASIHNARDLPDVVIDIRIAHIAHDKPDPGIRKSRDVSLTACPAQIVQRHDRIAALCQVNAQVSTYKTGAAGHQDGAVIHWKSE